jgi:hypothetical protein
VLIERRAPAPTVDRETGGSLGIAIFGAVLAGAQRDALTDGATAAHAPGDDSFRRLAAATTSN